MKHFLNDDFMLESDTAVELYNRFSKNLPIIDYHCHIDPKDIYEDRKYANITQAWLQGDHYKWRIMRACGSDEKYITGSGDDKEKFLKYAEALELSIGNPLYHWSHMELKKYFEYDGILSRDNSEAVWEHCNEVIGKKRLSVRQIIESSNVEVICTTDDPTDDLEWHDKLKREKYQVKVLPTFRPDKAIEIGRAHFKDYMERLSAVCGFEIDGLESLKEALCQRMRYFAERGCKISDYGLSCIPFSECSAAEADAIMQKALRGERPDASETEKFKTYMLEFLGCEYAKRRWAMQLHYGCLRDNNKSMFSELGPDTGYDSMNDEPCGSKLAWFLDSLERKNSLPKTIIYPLNDKDNGMIDTVSGCFQKGPELCRIQHGAAWWFNDYKGGIEAQMKSLAGRGVLGGFIGMLTDSRSFLSYTRHDYFRRILCSLVGSWIEKGEYPYEEASVKRIIEGISYYNAKNYFDF